MPWVKCGHCERDFYLRPSQVRQVNYHKACRRAGNAAERQNVPKPPALPGTSWVALDKEGMFALVDESAYETLRHYTWTAVIDRGNIYASTSTPEGPTKTQSMPRMLMGEPPEGMVIDHINGYGLDNRSSNTRFATLRQNAQHRRVDGKNNTSGYKGVTLLNGQWRARINDANSREKSLGTYATAEAAARAYDTAARRYHKEFRELNFPDEADVDVEHLRVYHPQHKKRTQR